VLLAEVHVFKGMGMSDVDAALRPEVMELVHSVRVATHKGFELETGRGDWENGEE
jgi:hypothetical protein